MASFAMRVVERLLRFERKTLDSAEKTRARLTHRSYPAAAPVNGSVRRACEVTETSVRGHRVITLRPKHVPPSPAHIIYTHGGCYVNPLLRAHWAIVRRFATQTGATVTVPLYPLAPENTHEATYAFLDDVYSSVLATTQPSHIVLAGDSAGSGLALGQTLRHRDAGCPLPGLLLLISPWLDLTLADPAAAPLEADDIMLGIDGMRECGRMFAGATDLRAPHLSPLFADLSRLPPMHVFQGTHDLLLPDARTFAERARAAGSSVELHEYPGGFHDFMGATFLPESRDAFAIAARAIASVS